jgi:hypothetical protein
MDINSPEWSEFFKKLMASRHKEAALEFESAKKEMAESVSTKLAAIFTDELFIENLKKAFFQCKQEDKLLAYNMFTMTEKTLKEIIPQALTKAAKQITSQSMTHEFNKELEEQREQWRKENPELVQKSIFDKDNEGAKFTLARR